LRFNPVVADFRLAILAVLAYGVMAQPGFAQRREEVAAAEDCPEEQLSCGRQRPVVSDGVRPFENEEMGLRAAFPAASQVCMGRSGDAARGFYAWYGRRIDLCEGPGEPPAFVGVGSSWNAADYRTLRRTAGDCQPLSPAMLTRFGGRGPRIPGHASLACQAARKGGGIEITVHAMAGRSGDAGPRAPPRALYWATLGTRAGRVVDDIAMFQAFLANLQIGLFER
jgi:hypothetical protein